MTQFPSTEDANKSYKSALEQYRADKQRIKEMQDKLLLNSINPSKEDILWLCQIGISGIDAQEASWYDHG